MVILKGYLAISGDVFGSHSWGVGSGPGTWWGETRGLAKHPTVHKTAPPTPARNEQAPNIVSAKVEKPRFKRWNG